MESFFGVTIALIISFFLLRGVGYLLGKFGVFMQEKRQKNTNSYFIINIEQIETKCHSILNNIKEKLNIGIEELFFIEIIKPWSKKMKDSYNTLTAIEKQKLDNPSSKPSLPLQCLSTMQDKIIKLFQSNSFNDDHLYFYNSLSLMGENLKKLYLSIIKYGLDNNIIEKKEFNELKEVLLETIRQNIWM